MGQKWPFPVVKGLIRINMITQIYIRNTIVYIIKLLPHFHTPVTSTRHFNTNPSLVESVTCGSYVSKWRIYVQVTDFEGPNRGDPCVGVLKWRVEVTDVWKWAVPSSNSRNADKAGLQNWHFSIFWRFISRNFFYLRVIWLFWVRWLFTFKWSE